MELETKFHGDIEIEQEELITFPQGIPGFIDKKEYVLLPLNDESPFFILQSTEEKNIAFITITPWDVIAGYEFDISETVETLLEVEKPADILVLSICTITDKLENMTVNLAAPVLINHEKKLGKQIVIDESHYSIKHPAFSRKQRQEAK